MNKKNGYEATIYIKTDFKNTIVMRILVCIIMIFSMNLKGVNASVYYNSSDEKEDTEISIWGEDFSVEGKNVNLHNILSVPYLAAQKRNDTLAVVLESRQLEQWLNINSIRMPRTEEQIKLGVKHTCFYKSVEDMEHNTDGNYNVPYLFLMNDKDTLQYIITFPINKPYTYELCTARFADDSHNDIARTIYQSVQRLGINTVIRENTDYNYIWLLSTELEGKNRWHNWSILLKVNGHITEWCLFAIHFRTIVDPECIWSYCDLSSASTWF